MATVTRFCLRCPIAVNADREFVCYATTLLYMAELQPIKCPHCEEMLTETEIRSILGRFARSKRFSFLGASRFAKMTPEQRSAEARRAAIARWAKRNSKAKRIDPYQSTSVARLDDAPV